MPKKIEGPIEISIPERKAPSNRGQATNAQMMAILFNREVVRAGYSGNKFHLRLSDEKTVCGKLERKARGGFYRKPEYKWQYVKDFEAKPYSTDRKSVV